MSTDKNINSTTAPVLTGVELIKDRSNYLRGTLKESLSDELTGGIRQDDLALIKFHGSYQQNDRDLDNERKKQKLEPLYSFMLRIRVPGGVSTAEQWLKMDELSDKYANNTLKLSTRQAYQLHGVLKGNLKPVMQHLNQVALTTIAACGDVNRNVMFTANPNQSPVHQEVLGIVNQIDRYFYPQTTAYHEIWLDGKPLSPGQVDVEPIYGKHYLPRKFKMAFAIPPQNDVDLYANDLGFTAVVENDQLVGFNVVAGGGMGMTFGINTTYPRLADELGYLPKDKVQEVAEAILLIQREYGNREDRKSSRMKYTIDKHGLDWFKTELSKRLGWSLEASRFIKFHESGETPGWTKGVDDLWYFTLLVEGGRVRDAGTNQTKTALKEIAKLNICNFVLTGNQNVVLGRIKDADKMAVAKLLGTHGAFGSRQYTGLRTHAIACAALPLCGLSFAEAERYLPKLIDKLDESILANGLEKNPITIRMTGCPNGCGRPFLAEIGLVGRAPGKYNLYLGASFEGTRLNKLYKEMLDEDEILAELKPIIKSYAKEKHRDERFGDFVIRKGYVKASTHGKNFHENLGETKKMNFDI